MNKTEKFRLTYKHNKKEEIKTFDFDLEETALELARDFIKRPKRYDVEWVNISPGGAE